MRALAVTSGQRVPGVDLPTMAEAAGIPEFDIAPVWGVLLPAGAPAADRRAAGSLVRRDQPDGRHPASIIASTHAAPFPGNAKALADFLPKEIKKWEELAKLAKIEPQ